MIIGWPACDCLSAQAKYNGHHTVRGQTQSSKDVWLLPAAQGRLERICTFCTAGHSGPVRYRMWRKLTGTPGLSSPRRS